MEEYDVLSKIQQCIVFITYLLRPTSPGGVKGPATGEAAADNWIP